MGADLLDIAVPETAVVTGGRKELKITAASVGWPTLKEPLGSGIKKKSANVVLRAKFAEQTSHF